MSGLFLNRISIFSGRVVLFAIGLGPTFEFAPQPASDLSGHCGNAFFVFLIDVPPLASQYPIEDQMLNFVGDQFVCHGGEVEFTQVYVPKKPPPLLALLCRDVIGVALVLALEMGGVVGNIDVDPLLVVVEVDAKIGFGHVCASLVVVVFALYIPTI